MRSNVSGGRIALAIVLVSVLAGTTEGGLVYWQNFEGGNGVADIGTGDLGITNNASPAGNTFFSASDGVGSFGSGSYDATANISGNNSASSNGIASSGATGGTALSALPNSGTLNQFTISFWFKTQALGTSNRAGRLLTLGEAGTTDFAQVNNSIGFVQIANGAASGVSKVTPIMLGKDVTSSVGIGADNNLNEWTFIAVTYDGTSGNGDNSAIQLAATGSSINGQFYRGTDAASVVRTDLPFVATVGTPSSASLGPLNLGTSAILFLANRTNLSRSYDGWLDDIRIYDTVLNAADVELVRQQGLLGIIPEPSAIVLASIGILGAALIRKCRKV